ncbi:MAG: DUF4230 domain-containing protein [Thermoanaerobaculia bacterium]
MKRASAILLPWLLAVVFAAVAALLLRQVVRGPSSSRADSAPVVMAIRKIARLATVEVQVSDVVRYEEFKSFLFLNFPKSAVLQVRGAVVGGFDLDRDGFKITSSPSDRTVKIQLPRPTILSIDPRLQWFDEKSGIFNPITSEDRNRWMVWARTNLARTAKDAGMDRKAEEQAVKLLSAAAQALGWKAEITFDGPQLLSPQPPATD